MRCADAPRFQAFSPTLYNGWIVARSIHVRAGRGYSPGSVSFLVSLRAVFCVPGFDFAWTFPSVAADPLHAGKPPGW
jgi:hypothetical protein